LTLIADRYRLVALHARGGMADIHRATDERLGRTVAVKILRDASGEQNRFEQEARLLARLQHPHLVRLLDVGDHDGRPFLVLEFIKGPTLAAFTKQGPVAPGRVRHLAAELADALAYLHARSVVHRDVKPSNVLIDERGSAKLADFGIARLIDSGRVTSAGQAIGSMAYMAPEQVQGERAGPPADIYALGLVLLELLTGQPPFEGTGREQGLARLARDPVVPPELGHFWSTLLRAMTARSPADRPSAARIQAWLRSGSGRPSATVAPPAGEAAPADDSPTQLITAASPGPPRGAAPPAPASGLQGVGRTLRSPAAAAAAVLAALALAGFLIVRVPQPSEPAPAVAGDPLESDIPDTIARSSLPTTSLPLTTETETTTTLPETTTTVAETTSTERPTTSRRSACSELEEDLADVRAEEQEVRESGGSRRRREERLRELEEQRRRIERNLQSCRDRND
jgi:serine/threonine protein kinase